MSKLIFGCGYLGQRVAERWQAAGDDVFVVTRSPERAKTFAEAGYAPIVADVVQPGTLADLPLVDTVVWAVGFDRTAGVAMHQVYVDGLHAVLAALPAETGKLLYISSTGVYGPDDGETVDELSPTRPNREGGRASLAGEQVLAEHALGQRAVVLRLSGIYGPGRVPYIGDIRAGKPLAVPAEGLLNLIHVEDAATVVMVAEARAEPPRLFLVSDGHPVERGAYFQELARLLAAPPVNFATPAPDSPAAQRASSSKRVNNGRMATELGAILKYPTYREGLAAILAQEHRH